MSYGIMRIERRKKPSIVGIQKEANRTQEQHQKGLNFVNSEIDWSRTNSNVFLVKCENWNKTISQGLEKLNIKPRSNSVLLLDGLYTASPDFFNGKSKQEIIDYFKDCLDFHKKHYGAVVNAVIHFDETTPHMQVASVPIYRDSDNKLHLSARELASGYTKMRSLQNEFYDEVSKKYGLERGTIRDGKEKRKHITAMEHKERTIEAHINDLSDKESKLDKKCDDAEKMLQDAKQSFKKLFKTLTDMQERISKYDNFLDKFYETVKGWELKNGQGKIKTVSDAYELFKKIEQEKNLSMEQSIEWHREDFHQLFDDELDDELEL